MKKSIIIAWIKWGIKPKINNDKKLSRGSFIGIDKFGGMTQIKHIKGKWYDDFDYAGHYAIRDDRFTHYCYMGEESNNKGILKKQA